eukprot:1517264-Rhodomonas_salina.1
MPTSWLPGTASPSTMRTEASLMFRPRSLPERARRASEKEREEVCHAGGQHNPSVTRVTRSRAARRSRG